MKVSDAEMKVCILLTFIKRRVITNEKPRVYGYNIPHVFDQSERKQYIVSYFLCELGYQLVLDSDDKMTVDSLCN